jgi:hypothetical protein
MSKNRLETQLLAYGALAVAGTVAGVAPTADAAIVYSGPVNINVPSTTSGIYMNVVTGVFGTTPASAPGWDLNPWSSSGFSFWANNGASVNDGVVSGLGSSTTLVDNLPAGTLIDGTQTYARTGSSETTGATAFVLNSTSNLIGFRFLNEADNQYHFGWARVQIAATMGGQPRGFVEYAYEDQAGVGIPAGAVPAPGSVALLALGAAGLAGRRRKA